MSDFGNPHPFSVSVGTTEVALCTLLPSNLVDIELILTSDSANAGTIYVGPTGLTAGTTRATDGTPIYAGKARPYFVTNPKALYARASSGTNIIYVEPIY